MEIKNHFGVYGVCLQEGKLLCIEKTRGPYQNRFDLPGGGQELGEGLTETLEREVLEETGYTLSRYFMISYSILSALKNPFLKRFLMEAMIQQMQFGFLSSRLPKKMPHP